MENISEAFAIAIQHHQHGRLGIAEQIYRRILQDQPNHADAIHLLGVIAGQMGDHGAAIEHIQRAIALQGNECLFHNNLGEAYNALCRIPEALACYRRALELNPHYALAHSSLLLTLQYCPGITPAALAEAHAEFDRRHAAPLRAAWKPHSNSRDPNRKLRLGFVSGDFGAHPVGYFLIRALENLDRSEADVVCYSGRGNPDDLTRRFRNAATIWRNAQTFDDEQFVEQIRADQIDVLFDLAGHTAGNRLLVFARKPAPVQLTWAGYVGTTGLNAIDGLIADPYYVPAEWERHYCERILRLPNVYVSYDAPTYAPPVKSLPALESGQITFGSFNNPAKINSDVVRVWAEILRRVPCSRLTLKYRRMSDPLVAAGIAGMFAEAGIEPGRLDLFDFSPHAELLDHYNRVDIGLDPFPYNGGLTTCEALWMGVPVVTCPGETFAGRHSLSYLSVVGLTELVARDLDAYVELAVSLASDLPRLAALRAGLRERMAASPLCDGRQCATDLMTVLRDAWRRWVAGNGSPT